MCMYIYTYTHMSVQVCMNECVNENRHVNVCMHISTHTHIYIYIYLHIYALYLCHMFIWHLYICSYMRVCNIQHICFNNFARFEVGVRSLGLPQQLSWFVDFGSARVWPRNNFAGPEFAMLLSSYCRPFPNVTLFFIRANGFQLRFGRELLRPLTLEILPFGTHIH